MSEIAKHVVCWSGGCDSTYLLHRLIADKASKGERVLAVSIKCQNQTPAKYAAESLARGNLWAELQKLHAFSDKDDEKIKWTEIETSYYGDNKGLSLAYIWLTSVLPMVEDGGSLYIGYIMGDHALRCTTEMRWAASYLSVILGKSVEVRFPFVQWHAEKKDVLRSIPPALLELCTWCEEDYKDRAPCRLRPNDKARWCRPCLCHDVGLLTMSTGEDLRSSSL